MVGQRPRKASGGGYIVGRETHGFPIQPGKIAFYGGKAFFQHGSLVARRGGIHMGADARLPVGKGGGGKQQPYGMRQKAGFPDFLKLSAHMADKPVPGQADGMMPGVIAAVLGQR